MKVTIVTGTLPEQHPAAQAVSEAMIAAWLDAGRGPYTSAQLNEAFGKLDFSNVGHWKMPIDVEVEEPDIAILCYAVPWHCGGGVPDFTKLDNGKYRMTHPGYFACIGA